MWTQKYLQTSSGYISSFLVRTDQGRIYLFLVYLVREIVIIMIHRARQNTNISLVKKQFVLLYENLYKIRTKKTFIHKSSFVLVKVLFCAKDKLRRGKRTTTTYKGTGRISIYIRVFCAWHLTNQSCAFLSDDWWLITLDMWLTWDGKKLDKDDHCVDLVHHCPRVVSHQQANHLSVLICISLVFRQFRG